MILSVSSRMAHRCLTRPNLRIAKSTTGNLNGHQDSASKLAVMGIPQITGARTTIKWPAIASPATIDSILSSLPDGLKMKTLACSSPSRHDSAFCSGTSREFSTGSTSRRVGPKDSWKSATFERRKRRESIGTQCSKITYSSSKNLKTSKLRRGSD